jgi:hypothetical protein
VIGWISKTKKQLALKLSAKKGPLLEYACGSDTRTVTGAVLLPLTADKMAASASLKLSESKGKQKPEALEGAGKSVLESSLNGGTPEQAGLGGTLTLTSEEPVEINTTV